MVSVVVICDIRFEPESDNCLQQDDEQKGPGPFCVWLVHYSAPPFRAARGQVCIGISFAILIRPVRCRSTVEERIPRLVSVNLDGWSGGLPSEAAALCNECEGL